MKLSYLILLAGGITALCYGLSASDSLASRFSRLFTGTPTDQTVWLVIGGAVAIAVGAGGLLRGAKSS